MADRSNKRRARGPAETAPPAADARLRVVALGASAGGLKAVEAFFRHVPSGSGMAFVLAMHLSPDHESQLAGILQAFTAMPVVQVSTAVKVASDHVYVIAPGQRLSIEGDRLVVSARDGSPSAGVIDHLFLSLAEDRQELAVGIVLSGSGADGTLGMRAIKERGGILLAQDPGEAEYDAMPRSIIATGLVDFVLPAAEMPARLAALRDRVPRRSLPAGHGPLPESDARALQDILERLHAQMGHDFTHYKRTTLRRQLGRRMLLLQEESLPAYARRLQKDDAEVEALFRNLLVSVTRFFRDPEAYLMLAREVLPKLFAEAAAPGGGEPAGVRVWAPGCATGEEAYSLAMLLVEHREAAGAHVPIQLLATDIDDAALATARRGCYPEAVVAGVSQERLQRFFIRKEGTYQVTDGLRALVLFAAHDLTRDPPFARIDLLSCRNLLMYFEAGMQQHVLERFAYSLRPEGFLFLGTAESTGQDAPLFTPLSKKHGLFQRTGVPRPSLPLSFFPVARAFSGPETPPPSRAGGLPFGAAAATGAAASDRSEGPVRNETGASGSSNDVLIVANQEMQSLNEELRSMVEELEVAKEEMQSLNEELTTVNQELQNKIEEHRRVNNDLHVLIESTNLATLFLDQHLNVALFTPEATKLFSLLPIDIGRPLEHLVHRLTYPGVVQDAAAVLASSTEVRREVQTQDGTWYAMRAMPYASADRPTDGVVLTFADITVQKEVEQVSADRFTLAFHAGPMAASIVTRDDGRFLNVNEHFEQITGYRREEVVGQPARAFGLFFGDELDPASTDRTGDPAVDEVETRIRTKSGSPHDLVVSTTAIEFEGHPCYLSLFYDVTERKRLEREILLVSDREQRRIGVDLHDGLGTHLTGVAMMTRGLARNLRAGRSVSAEEMEDIARLLSEGIEQARTLAQGLNPFLLEVRGLSVALRELAANMEAQTGIVCSFEEELGGMALSSEQSMHLYRIAQEALTNAARHAHPTRIQITLARRDQRYRLKIEDDGRGFQQTGGDDGRGRAAGMGLSIMRYRAEMIGARLHVTSVPGEGTTITCFFRTAT